MDLKSSPKKISDPGFYRSCVGLDKNHKFKHIFNEPISILACRLSFELTCPYDYRRSQLVGKAWCFIIPPPARIRKWLSQSVNPRRVSEDFPSLAHFIEPINIRKRKYIPLRVLINRIRPIYRFNRYLIIVLALCYNKTFEEVDTIIGKDRGLRFHLSQVVDEETVLTFASMQGFFWLRRRMTYLESIRTCFDAVALAFQFNRRNNRCPPNSALSFFGRMKIALIKDPFEVAAQLKELAFNAREFYFGRPKSKCPLISWMSDKESLQFSYIGRSLPPPLKDPELNSKLFSEFKERLTADPPPEREDWRPFVKRFLEESKPPSLASKVFSQPSNSATIGYSRKVDGHLEAYRDYVLLAVLDNLTPPAELYQKSGFAVYNNSFEQFAKKKGSHANDALEYYYRNCIRRNNVFGDIQRYHPQQFPAGAYEVRSFHSGNVTSRFVRDLDRYEYLKNIFGVLDSDLHKECDSFLRERHDRYVDERVELYMKGGSSYDRGLYDILNMDEETYKETTSSFYQTGQSIHSTITPEAEALESETLNWDIVSGWTDQMRCITGYYNDLMTQTVFRLVRSLPYMIVQPIFAEEKGLKVRVPTRTLTLFSLILQPLRKAADAHLLRDNRTSASLGGKLDVNLSADIGPWYSLDLSVATDQHPFWLTKVFYEELIDLHPELELFREFLPKLFGPHYVLNHDIVIPSPPKLGLELEDVMGILVDTGYLPADRPNTDIPFSTLIQRLVSWCEDYNLWLQSLYNLPGFLSKRGAMMGNATSWPLLPLVTLFSASQVGINRVKTCGDDALLGRMDEANLKIFNKNLESLGAIISEKKSFVHKDRGLFTEIPFEMGDPQRYELVSYWVAPMGGSKGQINWFNLPDSYASFLQGQLNRKPTRIDLKAGLWKYTKFHYYYELAFFSGLPLGAISMMGGINHPLYPRAPRKHHTLWSNFLSTRKVFELLKYGGLSLIPKRGKKFFGISSSYLDDALESRLLSIEDPDDPTLLLAKDGLGVVDNPVSLFSVFHKGYQREFKNPSVHNLSDHFFRRLKQRRKPVNSKLKFSASGLEKDLLIKTNKELLLPPILSEWRERPFGVFTSEDAPVMDLSTYFFARV